MLNKIKKLGNHYPVIDAFGNILAYATPARKWTGFNRLVLNPDFKVLHSSGCFLGNPVWFDWKHQFSIHHIWLQNFYIR